MDIVGPFSMEIDQRRFLLVVMDYFSKWVEVEPLTRISEKMAEVTNREILKGLRARLDHAGGNWVDKLPSVLWALHTTPKEVTGVTPFQLMYGGEAVALVEVGVKSDQVQLYDERNIERRLMELDLVDESRDKAIVRLMAY
ncbi:uncharacterized protein LOC122048651 [Zingiber officinale]|uniref:uncharacterized protein LOC122048651 n=1 Tax=Zingiber officinale TaxID=94328 RepID=UPI001C4B9465|nr:uncharacterized protein LOC122048651 [Zingiber officinale]